MIERRQMEPEIATRFTKKIFERNVLAEIQTKC